jgi:hypothetical protein
MANAPDDPVSFYNGGILIKSLEVQCRNTNLPSMSCMPVEMTLPLALPAATCSIQTHHWSSAARWRLRQRLVCIRHRVWASQQGPSQDPQDTSVQVQFRAVSNTAGWPSKKQMLLEVRWRAHSPADCDSESCQWEGEVRRQWQRAYNIGCRSMSA